MHISTLKGTYLVNFSTLIVQFSTFWKDTTPVTAFALFSESVKSAIQVHLTWFNLNIDIEKIPQKKTLMTLYVIRGDEVHLRWDRESGMSCGDWDSRREMFAICLTNRDINALHPLPILTGVCH